MKKRHKDLNFIVATEVNSLKPLKPFFLKLLNIIQFACCRFQLNFANFTRQLGTNTARKLYKADGERASVHQGPPPTPVVSRTAAARVGSKYQLVIPAS